MYGVIIVIYIWYIYIEQYYQQYKWTNFNYQRQAEQTHKHNVEWKKQAMNTESVISFRKKFLSKSK